MIRKLTLAVLVSLIAANVSLAAQNKDDFKEKVMYVDFRNEVHTVE